ncbi:MAG: hypothetical protein H0W64_07080 [Gammaproteobacteria bacterium]|nr:hypothetical protein [Gammaproteobacteria bacterium]
MTTGRHSQQSAQPLCELNTAENKNTLISDIDKMPLVDAAKQAVELVGPRVYELTGFKHDDLVINFVGCQGTGKDAQREVAELMNKTAIETGRRPDLMVFLGDNIYEYGASSPLDPEFNPSFNEKYYREDLQEINQVPSVLVEGNHEYRYFLKAFKIPFLQRGKIIALNETAHNYVPDNVRFKEEDATKFNSVAELIQTFSKLKLPLKDMQAWTMPYYFYSLIAGDTQIFLLDSNTFPADFLTWINSDNAPEKLAALNNNQAKWFTEQFALGKAAGRKTIVGMHHLFYTQSKRAFPSGYDTPFYLTPEELTQLQTLLHTHNASYNELLGLLFMYLKTMPDVLLGAHDHNLSYYNTFYISPEKLTHDPAKITVCQIGAGGGGGDLQRRKLFAGHPYTGAYLTENGYVTLTCSLRNPQHFKFDFRTLKKHHLQFTNKSHEPIQDTNAPEILKHLRNIALTAGEIFFKAYPISHKKKSTLQLFSSSIEGIKTGLLKSAYLPDEVDQVHDILAFFNQPTLPSFKDSLDEIRNLLQKLEEKNSEGSFFKIFQKVFWASKPFEQKDRLACSINIEMQQQQRHLFQRRG